MNKKTRRRRGKLQVVGTPCSSCTPDLRFTLLSVEEIMELPTADRLSFSLKVYAAAYLIAMQEYTGNPHSPEWCGLLQMCSEEIARGHVIEIRDR